MGTTTTRLFRRPLTDDEMTALRAEATGDPVSVIVGFYRLACPAAYGMAFDDVEQVRPTDFAIPDEQWKKICEWIVTGSSTPAGALLWMNKGPSGYLP